MQLGVQLCQQLLLGGRVRISLRIRVLGLGNKERSKKIKGTTKPLMAILGITRAT